MDFAPGEQYRYNNSAFILLGYIIELITEKSCAEYLHEEFLEPVGMSSTIYKSHKKIIINGAAGYQKENDILVNAEYMGHGAGALISTVDDLKTWYYAVVNDKVISNKNRKKAHTSYKLNNGNPTGYGYGWAPGQVQGYRTIGHGGGNNGYLTSTIFIPEKEIFIAVFSNCNCNPPGELALKLGAIALGDPFEWDEIKMDKKNLEEYVGVYESDEDNRTVLLQNDSLMLAYPEGMIFQLIPYKKDQIKTITFD